MFHDQQVGAAIGPSMKNILLRYSVLYNARFGREHDSHKTQLRTIQNSGLCETKKDKKTKKMV